MAKVSKRMLNPELQERIFEVFWQGVADLKTPKEVEVFFKDLLSPVEQIMLVKRLAIAILLTKGYSYEDIDQTLKVSKSTIMRVSAWLQAGGRGYINVIAKINQRKKKEAFWEKIEELVLQASRPAKLSSARYQRKKAMGKELYRRRRRKSII